MTVINVENVGKRYVLPEQHQEKYTTIRDTLTKSTRYAWQRLVGKNETHQEEEFWALHNLSFAVKEGERFGIIGDNGAGKSTLLKLLSRITEPTEGRITMRGRVGSLLEVGTGFHPELTGRENVYLNGAVLGMSHNEIRRKFDEIVAFAEIEKFLDMPVKRYSSGMYVRLAFAVAAHLEPEILIIDEVLAVGDAQFQKKCMGKIDEMGRSGRTILFVSHNMGAVTQTCTKCIVLKRGRLTFFGNTLDAVQHYMGTTVTESVIKSQHFNGPLKDKIHFEHLGINGSFVTPQVFMPQQKLTFSVRGYCSELAAPIRISFSLYSSGVRVGTMHDVKLPVQIPVGPFEARVSLSPYILRPGEYGVRVGGDSGDPTTSGVEWLYSESELISFKIVEAWSLDNDMGGVGLINLTHTGSRHLG